MEGLADADLIHEEEGLAPDDELTHLRDADKLMPPGAKLDALLAVEEALPLLAPGIDHAARILDLVEQRDAPQALQPQSGPKLLGGLVLEVLDAGKPVGEVDAVLDSLTELVEVVNREVVDGEVELAQNDVHRRGVREGPQCPEEAGGDACKSSRSVVTSKKSN